MKKFFLLLLLPIACYSASVTNKLLTAQETTNAIVAIAQVTNNPTFGTLTVTNGVVLTGTNGSRVYFVNDAGVTNVWYDGTNLQGSIIGTNMVTNSGLSWSINLTNLYTTNETPLAVWTNTIPTNNAFLTHFWGIGAGTNKYFFDKFASFYRDSGDVLLFTSNQTYEAETDATLDAYAITNTASNIVWYVRGFTNEPMGWTFQAHNILQTNSSTPSGDGMGGACTNLVMYETNSAAQYKFFNGITYWATKFTNTTSGKTICKLSAAFSITGSPTGQYRFYIADNHSSQVPGSSRLVETDFEAIGSMTNGWNDLVTTNTTVLVNATPYWFVVEKTDDSANEIGWEAGQLSGGSSVYYNGSAWVSSDAYIQTFKTLSSD